MSSKYEFIDGEKANYPIIKMCQWAEVSMSGFYEWRDRPASATAERGCVYLATVIDCHSRMVIGYALADHMRTSLVIDALAMARRNVDLVDGCIFHSDRGAQYTSAELAIYLDNCNMRGSMGRRGQCWDNALAESFFAALRNEFVYRTVFPSQRKAMSSIASWIEIRYNRKRLHSALGYRTPWEAHNSYVAHNRAA